MSKSRRFISGAVCPSCREVDRTVIEPVAGKNSFADLADLATESIQRRCVSCGFVEALQPGQTSVNVPLPRARYERSREATARATPVKIIDPSASKPS